MNHEVVEEIKKEDKKSMKKFIVIMIVSFFGGGIFGAMMGMAEDMSFMSLLTDGLSGVLKGISHYIILVTAVITAVFTAVIYRRNRKRFAAWDGEEEAVIEKIETELSWPLLAINICMIITYVFLVIGFGEMLAFEEFGMTEIIRICIFLGGIVLSLVILTVGTSKLVNFEKEINPEKKGSAYDTKFQKKWLESCDEAEKMKIYQSAFTAYKAVNTTCMILWFVSLVGITIWDYGIVPVILIGIIWLVSTISYSVEAMKLSQNKES